MPIAAHPGLSDWINDKTAIGAWTGLSDDALHIHLGLLILFAAAVLLRRPPWHWLPWFVVFVIETANEAYDVLQTSYSTDEGNLAAAWHDFWGTMLWPTVIVLTVQRLSRVSADQRPGKRADVGADVGPGEGEG